MSAATFSAIVITAAAIYVASAVAAVLNVATTFTVIAAAFTVTAAVFTITATVSSPSLPLLLLFPSLLPLPPIGHHIQSTQSGHGVTIHWHRFCSI
jgi:hypothetical protein